ncbi:hypothetical protein ER57_10620 [Smithella sp. SCADC]|jgi:hypothetical protein|nr:hypothetical protein ER57_10620 [Smithella sp. SCADC]
MVGHVCVRIIISGQSHSVTSIAGIPDFTTVSVRIPESVFRLIVPEVIEIVPSRVVGKVKSKPDGLTLI